MSDIELLTIHLERAANGEPGAIARFYEVLLSSDVVVPVDKNKLKKPATVPSFVGESGEEEQGFVVIEQDGHQILPIFSEARFVEDWTGVPLGPELPISAETKPFKTLLWMLRDETWLHLNPMQEVGKEISPWELERLKRGVEAIPEIAAELGEGEAQIEINDEPQQFPELERAIRPVLEIYSEIEEGFLISVSTEDADGFQPLLGIAHRGLSEERLKYIHEELKEVAAAAVQDRHDLHIVDDLADSDSPNQRIFRDARPFYFQKAAPEPSLWQRIRTLFTSGNAG